MKASFQSILNRDDCTDAQATTFLQQAISRIQRDCRLPSMERTLIITAGGPVTLFPAPADLIQPIDVYVQNQSLKFYALDKKSYRQALKVDPTDVPRVYARLSSNYYIFGTLQKGLQLMFHYFGNFSPFASGDADNELSASTPDLAVYGALSYAADTFSHPAGPAWEGRYQAIKAEVIQMAIDVDAEGGPQFVQPLYQDFDYE